MYAGCRRLALYAECLYAECRYAECRYPECRGAFVLNLVTCVLRNFTNVLKILGHKVSIFTAVNGFFTVFKAVKL